MQIRCFIEDYSGADGGFRIFIVTSLWNCDFRFHFFWRRYGNLLRMSLVHEYVNLCLQKIE